MYVDTKARFRHLAALASKAAFLKEVPMILIFGKMKSQLSVKALSQTGIIIKLLAVKASI